MPTPPVPRFADAMRATRKRLGWNQTVFARHFDVCRQTLARWEASTQAPTPDTRLVVLQRTALLPPDARGAILASLGANVAPVAAAPPARPADDAHRAMQLVIYRFAEELNLGARGVRTAFVHALAEMERLGLTVSDARAALGRAEPAADAKPGDARPGA
jgi:transcriptional regulator with XRE-family HTH domain